MLDVKQPFHKVILRITIQSYFKRVCCMFSKQVQDKMLPLMIWINDYNCLRMLV